MITAMDQFTNAGNEILKNFMGESRKYLKYHSSWDWLLLAYKKFTLLDDKEFVSSHKKTIDEAILNLNIEDAFLYLISAIKEIKSKKIL